MFGSNKKYKSRTNEELAQLLAPTRPAPLPTQVIVRETEYRPCWVRGKRALFHRWVNTARPTLPKGQEPGENARYYQFRSTQGLVEFESGAVELVYPQAVHFVDGGHFRQYTWPPAEREDENAGL